MPLPCRADLLAGLFALSCAPTFAALAGDPEVPLLTIGCASPPPQVDANLGPTEWSAASCPCGFLNLSDGNPATPQPRIWLAYDDEALYLAARFELPAGKAPLAKVTERDGKLWEDDALELFLDPGHTQGDYYQFIVNAAGAQWDSRRQDPSWNADWETRAATGKGFWSVEVRIPFAALGLRAPAPGELWGLNVAWDRQTPGPLIATWGHLKGSLHQPQAFGHLRFVPDALPMQVAGPVLSFPQATASFEGTWSVAIPTEARLTVARRSAEGAQEVAAASVTHSGGGGSAPLKLVASLPKEGNFAQPGDYTLRLRVPAEGEAAYVAVVPVVARPPLAVALHRYLLAGQLEVSLDVAALGLPARRVAVSATLQDAKGKRLQSRASGVDEAGKATISLDISRLPAGDYRVVAGAMGPRQVLLQRVTVPFTKPSTPDWLGSTQGIGAEVLPPWTPVQAAGGLVKVWGREYAFSALPFPSAVTTAEASILAGPVVLRAVADGKELSWQQMGDPRVLEAKPDRALIATGALAEGLQCSGQVAVEYDGMVRSDFTLSPRGARQLEHLSLVIPIKEEHAKYLYHFPGRWGSSYNAGALPAEGFKAGFRPFVWLGDEERGFAWFSESDRGFAVEDPNAVTQITREGGAVTLRINMVTKKQALVGPLRFTFGFHATPVKPMTPDAWDYRICHHGSYGIESQPYASRASIVYPAEGNIRLDRGTFEAWVRPRFNPQPDIDPNDPSRGRLNHSLFDVSFDGDDHIGFYWNIDDKGMRVYYKQGTQYPLLLTSHQKWNVDEWHHVALTWGDKTCIWVDGAKVSEKEYKGTLPRSEAGATVSLGTGTGEPSEFEVDEVRISDIPREGFDLTQPCQADEHTLLLDRLDAVDPSLSTRDTRPEKGKAGRVVGGAVVVGKWGSAFGPQPTDKQMTVLDRLAELGVRTICFHEHWTDIQNSTSTTHGEALKRLVKACHERGIRLLLYFGYEMSNILPEWEDYHEECLVAPRAGGYKRQPEQTAYIVCYNSKWQDYIADGIARVMDEYDIDGVYLDGTEYPWGCANLHHGCGYTTAEGTVKATYPFFAYRDMLRRIYTIVKSRKPDGEVNVHNSTCMTTPSLAWATSTWDGEQFGGIERGPEPLTVLPLDAFRAEFMGRNWGVPAEFLCYNRPYTYEEAMAFTLLHDVLVRGSLGGSLELESKLWKGMEAFGRSGAVWLPYWNNGDYVVVGPDESVKASLYSRAEDGVVVVVSNLSRETKQVTVRLKRDGLALAEHLAGTDMVSDEAVTVSAEGEMNFPLRPFGFRVIWVRPRNSPGV